MIDTREGVVYDRVPRVSDSDEILRLKIVEAVLEFHADQGADQKRLEGDFSLIYNFIKNGPNTKKEEHPFGQNDQKGRTLRT